MHGMGCNRLFLFPCSFVFLAIRTWPMQVFVTARRHRRRAAFFSSISLFTLEVVLLIAPKLLNNRQ
ncbi:hypothetical protein J3F83DRAFT_738795 [Trichoderma novae-zelandiae]